MVKYNMMHHNPKI